jgi:hypothetical protein
VTKLKHPLKGTKGIVSKVLYGQATASTMKIEMRVNKHYSAALPWKLHTVDFDHVVEIK